jgi:peroxiredoxin
VLERGNQVPHFQVTTVSGSVFNYAQIWQRKNLLLVLLSPSHSVVGYVSDLGALEAEFQRLETTCVIARASLPDLRAPAVLVADRWGEVVHAAAVSDPAHFPAPAELLEWLQYIQHRCPECEGETK